MWQWLVNGQIFWLYSWIFMMASCKRRFPASTTRSIISFFSTNKEAVDREMEEKDNGSDEEATD